jgi:hypothetical protein
MGEISRYTPPCPMQSGILRPRFYAPDVNGNLDVFAYPNCCVVCKSDEGNWNCSVYQEHMKNKPPESGEDVPVIPMIPEHMPEEYRKSVSV